MRRGRPLSVLAGLAVWLLAGGGGFGAETPAPPAPDRWLTDEAGFLSAAARAEIDARLESFERASGHQVLVYIGRTTGGVPVEDWAARAFREWRVGRARLDDGLALFIMAEDRRVRIEVGYGLEERVPDIVAGRIINDVLLPGIRAGDNDAAVRDAVAGMMEAIVGPGTDASGRSEAGRRASRPMSPFEKILVVVAVIGFLILFITNPSLALWLIFSILSGGRGGGGGGGRGFRGGGGRSGGGGASGSW